MSGAAAVLKLLDRQHGTVALTVAQVREYLEALDWHTEIDWSNQDNRARRGAECVLWDAATSATRDDGHWGGFQLRARRAGDARPLHFDDIVGGRGFDLEAWEVLERCRTWISDLEESDGHPFRELTEIVVIVPSLLSALALPHVRGQCPTLQSLQAPA